VSEPEGFVKARSGGAWLYLREGTEGWLKEGLETAFASASERRPVRGRGTHFTAAAGQGRILVRTVRRGGFFSFLGDNLFSSRRVFNEVRMLETAAAAGLNVPELLGFSIRGGLLKKILVVYREIEGVRTLEEAVRSDPGAIEAGARGARALHQAGILHGDLNCRNLLLRDGTVFIIDLDAARPSRRRSEFRIEIARLFRSLVKELSEGFTPELRRRFIEAYAGEDVEGLLSFCERRLKRHRFWWALRGR
jgi:tRNA A-37 threonylcarbamoyl transferase component Bud32